MRLDNLSGRFSFNFKFAMIWVLNEVKKFKNYLSSAKILAVFRLFVDLANSIISDSNSKRRAVQIRLELATFFNESILASGF